MDPASVFRLAFLQWQEVASMSDLWLVIDEMPAEVLAAAVIAAAILLHGATD